MCSGASYLEGALHILLSFDVDEVGSGLGCGAGEFAAGVYFDEFERAVAFQMVDDVGERVGGVYFDFVDDGGFVGVGPGANLRREAGGAGGDGHGQYAAEWKNGAVEREFAH